MAMMMAFGEEARGCQKLVRNQLKIVAGNSLRVFELTVGVWPTLDTQYTSQTNHEQHRRV